jgi:hypothetical protein
MSRLCSILGRGAAVARRTRLRAAARAGGVLVAGLLLAAAERRPAGAAITAVELSLTSVRAFSGENALLVRYEGGLLGRALVQTDYPLHLVVVEHGGGDYVRFAVASGAVRGTAPQLVDGATSEESLALLAEGEPLPGAELIFVGDGRVDVRLPQGVLSGSLDAFAFALYEGAALVSNTLPVEEIEP